MSMVHKVMISVVISRDTLEKIRGEEEVEKLISFVFIPGKRGGIGIASDVVDRVRIFFISLINGILK